MYSKAAQRTLDLVKEVIRDHHPHLYPFNIAVVMRDKANKKGGKVVMGTAEKFPDKFQPLISGDYHFLITLAQDVWDGLTPAQKRALVDHELCHCQLDDNLQPTMRPHDFEEFTEIIERHGFWQPDLRVLAEAVQSVMDLGFQGYVGTIERAGEMVAA